MKYKNSGQYYGSNLSFIDTLFNIIIVFVLLFFLAILLMNPVSKKKDIEAKADLLVMMTWPDGSPHDVDLWIRLPDGTSIGYPNKENTYMFLERDDLGRTNNFVLKGGVIVGIATRREVVTFRGKKDGRYVVNGQLFMTKNPDGVYDRAAEVNIPVIIELVQINPSYKVLARKEFTLTQPKEEKTAFAFLLRDDAVLEIADDINEPFIAKFTRVAE